MSEILETANDLKVEIQNSEVVQFYVNSAAINSSFYDFQIHLANQTFSNDNVLEVKEMCQLFMSPQHTKMFCKLLVENLNNYESKFGEIKIPDDFLNALSGDAK